MFITTTPSGGMGNQMFMLAHAVAQGLKNNVPVMISTDDWYGADLRGQHVHHTDSIFQNVPKVKNLPETPVRVDEFHFNDPKLEYSLDRPIIFYGYYQSAKNFLGFDEQIRTMYSPNDDDLKKIKPIYPEIDNPNTLSIHIRRGDYLSHVGVLPTIDMSYYNEAISRVQYDTLFVFSDDKQWASDNVNHPNRIIVDTNLMAHEEMWLMSLCKNNIICNSTFGWWGAFLNKNKDKKVFAPSIWFGPSRREFHPYDNIFMDDWILINVIDNNNKLYFK